jgi:hypothetical protein
MELQSTKRQCELVKSLLADATAENEIMYEVSKPVPLIKHRAPWSASEMIF